jgi:protein involved in polysaccharide export with SLBB domain
MEFLMLRKLSALGASCALLVLFHLPALAQSSPSSTSTPLTATRAQLLAALSEFEKQSNDDGYSARTRDRAKYEASLIKQRLETGDFQVGDKVVLIVDGEQTLSDTMQVAQDLTVRLPTGDTIALKGVLRSEVEAKLRESVKKVVRDPVVHAESFMVVSVTGNVGRQGYFTVKAESQLNDVLMAAAGPGGSADLTKIRVERGSKTIWEGEPLQDAITEGRTLDQMSLRAGDRVVVPASPQKSSNGGGVLGTLRALRGFFIVVPLVFALVRAL